MISRIIILASISSVLLCNYIKNICNAEMALKYVKTLFIAKDVECRTNLEKKKKDETSMTKLKNIIGIEKHNWY